MLGILAHSFMTATRTGWTSVRPVTPPRAKRKTRWLPAGHWWLDGTRRIDLNRL